MARTEYLMLLNILLIKTLAIIKMYYHLPEVSTQSICLETASESTSIIDLQDNDLNSYFNTKTRLYCALKTAPFTLLAPTMENNRVSCIIQCWKWQSVIRHWHTKIILQYGQTNNHSWDKYLKPVIHRI